MRKIPKAVIDALRDRRARVALFAFIDHPSGELRLWTGVGSLVIDGETWTGIGALGTVTGIQASSELQIVEHTYTLLHVSPKDADLVNVTVRGRRAYSYLGFLGNDNRLIADLMRIAETTLDVTMMEITEDGSVKVNLKGQSDLWQLERPLNVGLSDTEQRKHFPQDTGFSYVVEVTNQRLSWTRV